MNKYKSVFLCSCSILLLRFSSFLVVRGWAAQLKHGCHVLNCDSNAKCLWTV